MYTNNMYTLKMFICGGWMIEAARIFIYNEGHRCDGVVFLCIYEGWRILVYCGGETMDFSMLKICGSGERGGGFLGEVGFFGECLK